MKKLLLSIAFLATSVSAFSQITLNKNWTILKEDADGTTLGGTGLAYDSVNNKLYVANRDAPKISIINLDPSDFSSRTIAATGLATNPAWPATLKFNKIRVADDGAIYSTSVFLPAANNATIAGTVYIYRWAKYDDATPSIAAIPVIGRFGDSFAVHGTGANTKIYIGGTNHNRLITCSVNALGVVAFEREVTMPANEQSRGSISPVSADVLWVNSSTTGIGPRKVTIEALPAAAVTQNSAVGAAISGDFSTAEFFVGGAKRYLAIAGAVIGSTNPVPQANKGLDFELYDITTSETAPTKVASTRLYDKPAVPAISVNGSAYADVAIRNNSDGTITFFHLVFGVGMASYTTTEVLPVSLTSFTGSLVKGQSTLAWSTASESNNKGFDVLRSTDGTNFSSVGFVASKGENGNAATALSYSFVDRTAAAGVNYYQLNQIDNDGKATLSKDVVSVNVSLSGDAITVYPNPVTTHVNVSTGGLDFKGFKYEIFDGNGKKVVSQKAKSGEQQISVANLAPSVYYLKVSKDNVAQKTVKLIKE